MTFWRENQLDYLDEVIPTTGGGGKCFFFSRIFSLSLVWCSHVCLFLLHWPGMLGSACTSECLRLPVCVNVSARTRWAHGVALNQPAPVVFAQDMPQEAKTTVGVCPCCSPSSHTADSCVLAGCLSVFLYICPEESVELGRPLFSEMSYKRSQDKQKSIAWASLHAF